VTGRDKPRIRLRWLAPVLMRGQYESVFILTTHHSIADGLSTAYAIRDLIRLLTGENLESRPPIPAPEPLVYMSQHAPDHTDVSGQPEAPQEGRAITFRTVDGSLRRIQALQLTPVATRMLLVRERKSACLIAYTEPPMQLWPAL
jgi:hypothetical protein